MSWSGWSSRLNVTSIVSQGLEQVSKLKEDVEKQFDQAVQSAANKTPPFVASTGGVATATQVGDIASTGDGSGPDLFGSSVKRDSATASASAQPQSRLPPPSPVHTTVDDINVIKSTVWNGATAAGRLGLESPPPYSADGKQRRAPPSPLPPLSPAVATLPPAKSSAVVATAPVVLERSDDSEQVERAVDKSLGKHSGEHSHEHSGEHTGDDALVVESTLTTPASGDSAVPDPTERTDTVEPLTGQPPAPDDADVDDLRRTAALDDDVATQQLHETTIDDTTQMLEHASDQPQLNDAFAADSEERRLADEHVSLATSDADALSGQTVVDPNSVHDEIKGDDSIDVVAVTDDTDTVDDGAASVTAAAAAAVNVDVDSTTTAPSDSAVDTTTAATLQLDVATLQQHVHAREQQLLTASSTIQELHSELDRTCAREVAAVERARFLTEQLEVLRVEVGELNRLATAPRSSDATLEALQAAVLEKDATLQALLDEGQALSIKQAQLEQRVRQLRRERNDEEDARLKLQAQHDTLAIQAQDQRAALQAAEADNKRLTLELRQAQTAAESARRQLVDVQQTATDSATSVQTLRAQVEALTAQCSNLEREVTDAQHARESHELLASEKSELEETIAWLRQSFADLEHEAARREELARSEVADLKRKWKDADARVEALAQSVGDATQPLLRQIHALQDDQRTRQTAWQATEAALRQRVDDAIAQCREREQQALERDEQLHALQTKLDAAEQVAARATSELARVTQSAAANTQSLQERLDVMQRERDDWIAKCAAEARAKEQLERRVANYSNSSNRQTGADVHLVSASVTTTDTALTAELESVKSREAQLRHDLEWHQQELRRVKSAAALAAAAMTAAPTSSALAAAAAETQATILQQTLDSDDDDDAFNSASSSVLGMSQLSQRLRLREGENRLVKQQLQVLDAKQRQLADEVVRLSARNAELEASETRLAHAQTELLALQQRQHVLLELFGEKEEQVEELQAEVSELKAIYRQQLDTLAAHQQT